MLCQGTPGADPAFVASAAVPAPLLAMSGFTDLRLHGLGLGYLGLHEFRISWSRARGEVFGKDILHSRRKCVAYEFYRSSVWTPSPHDP